MSALHVEVECAVPERVRNGGVLPHRTKSGGRFPHPGCDFLRVSFPGGVFFRRLCLTPTKAGGRCPPAWRDRSGLALSDVPSLLVQEPVGQAEAGADFLVDLAAELGFAGPNRT